MFHNNKNNLSNTNRFLKDSFHLVQIQGFISFSSAYGNALNSLFMFHNVLRSLFFFLNKICLIAEWKHSKNLLVLITGQKSHNKGGQHNTFHENTRHYSLFL